MDDEKKYDPDEIFYMEFDLKCTLKTRARTKEEAVKYITKIVNSVVKHHELLNLEHSVRIASEEDFLSYLFFNPEYSEEN